MTKHTKLVTLFAASALVFVTTVITSFGLSTPWLTSRAWACASYPSGCPEIAEPITSVRPVENSALRSHPVNIDEVTSPTLQLPIKLPVTNSPLPEHQFRSLPVVLTSTVGAGFSAVIIILVLLIIGLWYFGNRVVAQLTSREPRNT